MGISSPVRYKLHLNLIKLKLFSPMEGKKIQLHVVAMNHSKRVDVLSENRLLSRDSTNLSENANLDDYIYSICRNLEF
jgi:hypothetical protein